MILVSGCPRSGTSMMMRIMKTVFGEDRILGKEKPQQQVPDNTSDLTPIQSYLKGKQDEKHPEQNKRAQDMNPNGYFEMQWSVRGVFYTPEMEDELKRIDTKEDQFICKIVSQGLARSDPRYVDKVIFMARDPRAVAKSQERLGRDNPMDPESAPERDGKKVLIRSVSMFNQVSVRAAQWLERHPDIPVLVVNYDELLDDPEMVLAEIETFLGEGDFKPALDMIDRSLRRSAPENIEGEETEFASDVFEEMLHGNWKGILDLIKKKIEDAKSNPPATVRWACPRLGSVVAVEMCKMCKNHPLTTANLIKNANNKKIDWRNEPCPYETGIQGGVGITIEESIQNNHWHALSQLGLEKL